MNRVHAVFTWLLTLILLATLTGLVGCQHGNGADDPVTPSDTTAQTQVTPPISPSGNLNLGYFQFVFDNDMVSVETVTQVRGTDINVTPWASIVIEDFWWDNDTRNWHIVAKIANISPFSGYDVWAVFHSLGNKFISNQDGFTWAMPPIFPVPTRCAFIAYGKDFENRKFNPMASDSREIIIHQPEGVPSLAPIGFWIDATIHPRVIPGVEDLLVESIDDTHYQLTGYIWDHQSPSADLIVWADATEFNGQNYIELFDDGEHGDGAAGDDIWGTSFEGNPDEGWYTLTVYAFDPEQNQGENDARFLHGEPCNLPIEPVPFEFLDIGEHSGIDYEHTAVINDKLAWEALWQEHTSIFFPPPPLPDINFETHTVIGTWIGWRPSNNHQDNIVAVEFDPCEDLTTVFHEYTPYTACGPLDVMTTPYSIAIIPKSDTDFYFVGTEVPCPEPPPECVEPAWWETQLKGVHSGIEMPYELKITGLDQWGELWDNHWANVEPPPPIPFINFDEVDVVAVATGEENTGGFECEVTDVCWLNNGHLGVFYKKWIPGPDCIVTQEFTQPFHWILVPKSEGEIFFFYDEEVYSCNDECQPQDFWTLADGPHSCEPPETFPLYNQPLFDDVWAGIHCWPPEMPPPPPVDWATTIPFIIQEGEFNTGGYYLTIDEICVFQQSQVIEVSYTLNIPGPNCPTPDVITNPWIIGAMHWPDIPGVQDFAWEFVGHEAVYDCPPCEPVPFYQLADGPWHCAEPGEYGFQGFGNDFLDMWYAMNCWSPDQGTPPPPHPEPPPPITPGGEFKPIFVAMPAQPTTGYYVTIDSVCLTECTAVVEYTLWIPGPDCDVIIDSTKPWAYAVAELPPIDCPIAFEFIGHEEVYECGDCIPVPFEDLEGGMHGCAEPGEYGFQWEDDYKEFWGAVNCVSPGDPMPPLPVDPEPINGGIIHHLGIQLPTRPSTGYFITVDEVCIIGCDVYIEWTEHIPGDNCNVLWVMTQPWLVTAVELPPVYCAWQWHFSKNEEVYDCPELPCFDFETVASGIHGPLQPGGKFFDNPNDFTLYWTSTFPGNPEPVIDWAGGWGAYAVHLGSRPTSGFEVDVYEVCESEDPFGVAVRWKEWIPGPDCEVLMIATSPYTIVTFPLVDMPYFDEGIEEVYNCD